MQTILNLRLPESNLIDILSGSLLANAVILHNVYDMTTELKKLIDKGYAGPAIARALLAERRYVWLWKQLATCIVAGLLLVSRGEVFKAWGNGQQIALRQARRRARAAHQLGDALWPQVRIHVAHDVATLQVARQG